MPDEKDNVLYARQEALNVHPPKCVAIIGCGGTGMHVGWLLAMVGVEDFLLFDKGTLSESNRARLPYAPEDVGKPKNSLLGDFIQRIRPDTNVQVFGEANDVSLPFILQYKPDYVFDCTDAREVQRELVKFCKDNNLQYVRVGYNGEHFTTDDTISTFTTGEVDAMEEHGYTIVPSYAPTALLPALLAVDGICRLGRIPKICTTATELINIGEKI
jgi:tRNA A37 threonylcarbamoyladenosine dehydratase